MGKVGINGKLYYGTINTVPSSTLVGGVEDVSFSGGGGSAESNDRLTIYTDHIATDAEWSVTVTMTEIPTDVGQAAMLAAFLAKTEQAYNIIDGTAGKGVSGNAVVVGWKCSRPRQSKVSIEMKLEGTGVPTFTA